MAGIVNSTKKRFVINKRIKEVEVPGTTLNISLFLSDLPSVGVTPNVGVLNQELGGLPTIVKNEGTTALVGGAMMIGKVFGMNGDTKSIEGFSFSRNSSATRWASDGKIYTVPPNDVRYGQDPKSGAYKGMLFEPAATNYLTYSGFPRGSQDISGGSASVTAVDTGWNKGALLDKGARIVYDPTITAPAYKHYAEAVLNKTYVFSCFVKMADGLGPMGGMGIHMFGVSFTSFNYEDYGNGIFRVWVSRNLNSISNSLVGVFKIVQSDNRTVVVTGYQLEEGIIPTSYIPTTDSQISRLADTLLSDRPLNIHTINSWHLSSEHVTGWFGNYDIQGRNLAVKSNSAMDNFIGYNGATLVRTDGIVVPEWGAKDANRVVSSGGTSPIRTVNMFGTPALGETVSLSGYFKNNGTKDIKINSNQGSQFATLAPGEQRYIKFEGIVGSGAGSVQFQVNPILLEDNVDFTWWRFKYEVGPACTPYSVNPSDFVVVHGNGLVGIGTSMPVSIRSLSLVPRKLNTGEF
ncbi:phage head spike fiber domain-containing protein [Sphingobacterium sp. 1.A.4]|uniref:phage head spike fiber domain-containing protein n=1 Tax=Sphingobacterium sp. 1.A.4 TaxID=2044603 RepID=UPI000C0BCC13|nr:hypothetical protein [Sphingobacterium sp. 1.A.4]